MKTHCSRPLADSLLIWLALPFLLLSLTSCGENGEEREVASKPDTQLQNLPPDPNTSTPTVSPTDLDSSSPAGILKAGMIAMYRNVTEVAETVKTVEDVEKVKPEIKKIMNDFEARIVGLYNRIDNITPAEAAALEQHNPAVDPEVQQWSTQARDALVKLQTTHPEAAVKLLELYEEYGTGVEKAVLRFQEKVGMKDTGDSAADAVH